MGLIEWAVILPAFGFKDYERGNPHNRESPHNKYEFRQKSKGILGRILLLQHKASVNFQTVVVALASMFLLG